MKELKVTVFSKNNGKEEKNIYEFYGENPENLLLEDLSRTFKIYNFGNTKFSFKKEDNDLFCLTISNQECDFYVIETYLILNDEL